MSPAACCLARRSMRAVSAMVSLMAAMPGGQGCPLREGTGASPSGMRRSAPLMPSPLSRPVAVRGASGRVMSPHRWLRTAACRSWARAARAVCRQNRVPGAGLALVPAECVLPGLERLLLPATCARDGDEERHGRRGVFRRPAQVEGQVVRAGDQAADEQEVPRAAGGDQRPVREPGTLGPVPARSPLEDRVSDRLVSPDDGPGRQGDAEVAGDDRHVRQVPGLAEPAQLAAAAVYLVVRRPFRGQARTQQAASAGRWPAAVSPCAPARRGSGRPGGAASPSPSAPA